MNITKDLKVEIQPRFEGATDPLAFYDVTGRVDADAFEFTSSADGSTANADIGLYTLFPFSGKRWNEYAATEAKSIAEALLDPTFRFEIPLRSEIKISQSYGDLSKYYAVTHYSQSGTTVTLTLNKAHTLTVGKSIVVTLAGNTSRSPNPLTLGGQRTIIAVTSTTISYAETTSRTISQTAVASGINTAILYVQVTELLFGGVMMSVEEKRAGGVILQQLTCADYTALLDERVIDRYRVPQNTYGWELITGGDSYEAGKIGANKITISPSDVPSYTFTQIEYDADTQVSKASVKGPHNLRRNERFIYEDASRYEYQVVGLCEDITSYEITHYRRSGTTVTLTLNQPHTFIVGDSLKIILDDDASRSPDPLTLGGQQTVTAVTSTTISYVVTASGTISQIAVSAGINSAILYTSGIYYKVCNGSPQPITTNGQQFKIWNHQVSVDSAVDHQLQIGQAIMANNEWSGATGLWNGIAKLYSTQYIVDLIENSRKFFFVHRAATPVGTGSSPMTSGNIVSPFLASGYNPVGRKESTTVATFTTNVAHGLSSGSTVLISSVTYAQLAPWTGGFSAVTNVDGTWYTATVSDIPDAYNFQVLYSSSGGEAESRILYYDDGYPLEIQAITTSIFEAIRSTDPYNEKYDPLGVKYLENIQKVETVRYNPILRSWAPGYPENAYEDKDALDRITTVADFWAELSPTTNAYAFDPIVSTTTSNVKHVPKVAINAGRQKQHRLQNTFRADIDIVSGELIVTVANNFVEGDSFYLRKIEGLASGQSPAFKTYEVNENTTSSAIHADINAEDAVFTLSASATAEIVMLPTHDENTGTVRVYTSRHHAIQPGDSIKLNNFKIKNPDEFDGGAQDNEFIVESINSKLNNNSINFSSINLSVGAEDPGLTLYPSQDTPSEVTTFEEGAQFLTTRTKRYRIIHARKESGIVELTSVIAEVIVGYEIVDSNKIKLTLSVEADSYSTNQVVRILGMIPPFSGLYSVYAVSGKTVTLKSYGSANIFLSKSAAVSGTPTWNAATKGLTVTATAHPFAVGDYVTVYYGTGYGSVVYREKILSKTANTFTVGLLTQPSAGSWAGYRAATGYSSAFTAKSYTSAGGGRATYTAASHSFSQGDRVSVANDIDACEVVSVSKDTVEVIVGANPINATGTLVLGKVDQQIQINDVLRYSTGGSYVKGVDYVLQISALNHGFVRNPNSLIDIIPIDVLPELEPEGGVAKIINVLSAGSFWVAADGPSAATSKYQITHYSQSGTTITLTLSQSHTMIVGNSVQVVLAGSAARSPNPITLGGEKKITAITSTTISYLDNTSRTIAQIAVATGTNSASPLPFDMVTDRAFGNFSTETSSALGVLMSRIDEGLVEHEAITVSGVGGSLYDSTVPQRVGGIKHYGTSTSENPMSIYWETSGLTTLYFAETLSEELSAAFAEGRSLYLDISTTNVGYEHKFAGIRTILNSSAVTSNDTHNDDRGKTAGQPYIQWVQDKAPANGAYTVAAGSVVSADIIQYVDTSKATDSEPYRISQPTPKNRVLGKFSQSKLTHWGYQNGVFRFTTLKKHGRAAGTKVYFASIGEMIRASAWNFNNLAPTTSKKPIKLVGNDGTQFTITVGDGSYKIKSIRCTNPTTDRDAFEVELSEDCAELYFPTLGFTLKGTLGSLMNNTSLSGIGRINARKFTFETQFSVSGILAGGKVFVSATASINFKEEPKTAFATYPTASFTNQVTTGTVLDIWSSDSIKTPFAKKTGAEGVSDRNYVMDLKIPKGDGGALAEMYYYEYLARNRSGSYTCSAGSYTVTTVEPHNLGDRQPGVVFTPTGGSPINVSAIDDPAKQLTVTGPNSFTFVQNTATVTASAGCVIQTRAAYVPSATTPTMPRNPNVYIGGRSALNFVKDKWNLLRTDKFYPSFVADAVGDTSVNYYQWWTFMIRPNTVTSDMKILQRGGYDGTYMAFGINSSGHPFVELIRDSTGVPVKYPINSITIEEEEECVLQFIVSIDPTSRVAQIEAHKNFDETGTTTSNAVFSAAGVSTDFLNIEVNGKGPGTVVVGAGASDVNTYEEPFDGYIAEIIGFDRLPISSPEKEAERMRAWLLHKYGLASLIDPDYEPDYRDINNVPNIKLPDSKQTKNVEFSGRTLRQVLDYISQNSGAQFWVDKNKQLHYAKISTSNLIENPMFENDRGTGTIKHWNGASDNHTLAKDGAGKFDRTAGPWGYGYAMKASGTSASSVYSDFIVEGPSEEEIVANDLFFVSAYVKSSDPTRMAVRAHFYSAATNTVGAGYSNSSEDLYDGWCNVDEWRRIWKIIKVPAGSTKFTIGLLALAGATSQTHYWTDIRVVKITGEFGFADEGNYSPNSLLLNSGETNSDMPVPTYPFESPDNIRSAGAAANRLYLYTTIPNSDENGITTTAISANQEVLEYTFDHVQGVWNSHGKIVEGSKAEEAAKTLKEVSGKASAFFAESGQASASYQFEHPNNGIPGLLTPGSVVPYLWSEVDIWEPMIVKSQSTKLIGPEMYHTVTLQQEPDYQKNALVLIGRRRIAVDLASASPATERPPAPQRFIVEPKDPDGQSGGAVDTVFDIQWAYPFGDAATSGVEAGGFEIQVRTRGRKLMTINKKKAGILNTKKAVVWSESGGNPQTLVSIFGKYPGLAAGSVVQISGIPEAASNKLITTGVTMNGIYRVQEVITSGTTVIGFRYYVMTPDESTEESEEQFKLTPAGYLLGKAIPAGFIVTYRKKQGGAFGKWLTSTEKTIETKGINTRVTWDPAELATDVATGDKGIDQDYQFRIRAIAKAGAEKAAVYNYSDWTQYPMADDYVSVGLEATT